MDTDTGQKQNDLQTRRYASSKAPTLTPEMPASALPPLLTRRQVIEWTCYSPKHLLALVDRGELHQQPSASDRRYILYPRDEVVRVREADPRYRTATEPQGATPLGEYTATIYPPETPASALPQFLSRTQVCAWVPLRKERLARYVRDGEAHAIPSVADQRYILYLRDEVVQIREERTRTRRRQRPQVRGA